MLFQFHFETKRAALLPSQPIYWLNIGQCQKVPISSRFWTATTNTTMGEFLNYWYFATPNIVLMLCSNILLWSKPFLWLWVHSLKGQNRSVTQQFFFLPLHPSLPPGYDPYIAHNNNHSSSATIIAFALKLGGTEWTQWTQWTQSSPSPHRPFS